MKVRIHRGAKEIGGSCIEVEASSNRIVLDVGRPLDAEIGKTIPPPDVPGLAKGNDPSLLALLISHGHQDHWGLFDQIHEGVPVYVGEGAAAVLNAAQFFSRAGADLRPTGHLSHREPFELGPFRITPYLNDHNGFDAYSMLIEADGKKLFYSGDFQGHGRKKAIFEELLRKPPQHVDVMLMEGTNVRPGADMPGGITEKEAEDKLVEVFKKAPALVLVSHSAQSIDRVVTVYRACKKTERTFVVDLYTATVCAATGKDSIPQAGWPNLRVYVPEHVRRRIARTKEFARLDPIKESRIYREEIRERRSELVMTFSPPMADDLEQSGCLEGAHAVWSMWPGYLETGDERALFERLTIPLDIVHASGHAYLPDLKKFADAIKAKRLVPIHSFSPELFAEHFKNVELRADGEWWEV